MGSKVTTKRAAATTTMTTITNTTEMGTKTTTMGVQQWHLKQLGQEFCFIFISQQTETGSCCCKIYKEKIRRKCKVFHGVFLSYQTFFSFLHIFMESWLEDGRQLNLLGEPRELITNPLDSLRTLRVWRNISMSRNHVRTMFVSPFLHSVPPALFGFQFSHFPQFFSSFICCEWPTKVLGGHKKSRVYLPSPLPVRLKCCA